MTFFSSSRYDDEPVSAEEAREADAAKASLARGEGISHEEVLAEFGLTSEDFARMGRITAEITERELFGAPE